VSAVYSERPLPHPVQRPTMTGTSASGDELFLRLYGELREIADRLLKREAVGHTLQPTALLHEAWLKLAGDRQPKAVDRSHYLALAARAMRQVLVDHARKRGAAKRGGDQVEVTLSDDQLGISRPLDEIIALDDALKRLAARDERLAKVVELRFFAGLGEDEAAAALGVTTRTVQRDWAKARAWLHAELADARTGGG
jgi:RNA polymerase sigma factor (TIGR02999 family)